MGAYGFKKQFVPFVLDGSKTHTIRGTRKHPDKPGSIFHGFYAMRTKQCQKLIEAPVLRVQEFRMERARVWIDESELDLAEKNSLAWRDGFRFHDDEREPSNCKSCFDLMLEFWVDTRKTYDFEGHIIHWDYEKRVISADQVHLEVVL